MFLFPINSNQFGLSYFYPGVIYRKKGSINFYDSKKIFKLFLLFSIIDSIFIGFCFYFKNSLLTTTLLFVIGLQLMLFFIRHFLASKAKIRVSMDTLGTHFIAPLFYWVTHFLMAFSIIYTFSLLTNSPHTAYINQSTTTLVTIGQFIFWLILSLPVINLILAKTRSLIKWI